MPHRIPSQTLALLASPLFSWRHLPVGVIVLFRSRLQALRTARTRRRERQELLDYLASDHRLAADIGYPHRLT